jgi:hypothetical protein
MELDPVIVGIELKKLKVKNPTYYQAHCPACKSVNKVSVPQMKADLDAVADEIEARAAAKRGAGKK